MALSRTVLCSAALFAIGCVPELSIFPEVSFEGLGGPLYIVVTPGSLPYVMKVGDAVRSDITFLPPLDATGYGTWSTSDPAVAVWTYPDPPCPRDRCAVLHAVGPGVVRVFRGSHAQGPPWQGGNESSWITVEP